MRPCGVLLWQARPPIIPRLESLLSRIQRIRANLYPAGWTADPLYQIEQEIKALLQNIK